MKSGIDLSVLVVSACVAMSALAAESMQGVVHSFESLRFERDTDVACIDSALAFGDPDTGPSTFVLKMPSGCNVPWHFHTAVEQAIVVRGSLSMSMQGGTSETLRAGGFAAMQSRVPHQFSCRGKSACVVVVSFDRTYDIVWGTGLEPAKPPH